LFVDPEEKIGLLGLYYTNLLMAQKPESMKSARPTVQHKEEL
jgi:hypothetical protein